MASHALRMLVIFIFVVATINLIYYSSYWSYNLTMRNIKPSIRNYSTSNRNIKKNIPIVKVVWLPGPRPHVRIKKTMHIYWTPELSCNETSTSSTTTVNKSTEKVTDYRDPEESTDTRTEFTGGLCPRVPPMLGPTFWKEAVDEVIMERVFSMLSDGGSYHPTECIPKHYVAVIVPYKGDNGHLLFFLLSLHLVLLKQQVDYQIYVVRQTDVTQPMNTGKFLNIGFLEAQARDDVNWTCFIFHDPNLAPSDARNLYRCSRGPRQLVYKIGNATFANKFGGVIAIKPKQFRAVNGFSNLYLDSEYVYHDLYDRLIAANYITLKPTKYAVYDNIRLLLKSDEKDTTELTSSTNAIASIIELTSTLDWQNDGLSSLSYSADSRWKISHVSIEVGPYKRPKNRGYLRSVVINIPENPSTMATPPVDETITTCTDTESEQKSLSSRASTQSSFLSSTPSSRLLTPSSRLLTPSSRLLTPSSRLLTPSSRSSTPLTRLSTPSFRLSNRSLTRSRRKVHRI